MSYGDIQATIRSVTGTSLTYEGDWHAWFDKFGYKEGAFSERMTALGKTIFGDNCQAGAIEGYIRQNGCPTMALDFSQMISLPSAITFSRNDSQTCATYFGSDGLLKTAAANIPRFDYDPVTLQPKGLLIEESRTNNELNGNAPTKGVAGDTVSANNAGAPDGTATAILHQCDGTSGVHSLLLGSGTPTLGNTYTISVFLKSGTCTFVQVAPGSVHGGATIYCNFNLSTGAMTAGAGIVASSNFCTAVGGGWYRCGFSYVASATASGAFIATWPIAAMSDTRSPTNSLSTNYYRWGGQFESTAAMGSAAFPTSYIVTTSSAVTRAADSASMTGTAFSSWWNATEGTFVVASSEVSPVGGRNASLCLVSGTPGLSVLYNFGKIRQTDATNSADTSAISDSVAYSGVRFAGSYKVGSGMSSVMNGGTVGTVGACATGTNTSISIGSGSGAINGHISRLTYFNKRLPDAQLQLITG